MSARSLDELKQELSTHLRNAARLKRPDGIPTGFEPLDQFLLSGGFPKGSLSLMQGTLGTGATSLWLEAANGLVRQGRWVVWINNGVPLSPLPLKQKGMNLGHFVSVEAPDSDEKLFWLLQELMSSSLFDLIGCDLGEGGLKEHQLRKLQTHARQSNVALVFVSQKELVTQTPSRSHPQRQSRANRGSTRCDRREPAASKYISSSVFSLILKFEKKRLIAERALHRPTPHSFARSVSYARFTSHLSDALHAEQSALDATSTNQSLWTEPGVVPAPRTSR